MHAALLLGLARLSPTNRALVEARYAQEVHLSLDRVATFLQETHPNIWQANSEAWSPHERLSEACGLAFQQLNIEANHCLRLLEGGADECASA